MLEVSKIKPNEKTLKKIYKCLCLVDTKTTQTLRTELVKSKYHKFGSTGLCKVAFKNTGQLHIWATPNYLIKCQLYDTDLCLAYICNGTLWQTPTSMAKVQIITQKTH